MLVIPKLYDRDGTTLLEYLSAATVCEVTEERNGIYEFYMEIPTGAEAFPAIETDRWIYAKPSENGNPQMFRVYDVGKKLEGLAIVSAEHISYLLNGYPVDEVEMEGATASVAMNLLIARAESILGYPTGFQAFSDLEKAQHYGSSCVSVREALGGMQGSMLQRYGGEYEFDGKIVRLLKARGRDNGVRIEYRKNLTGLKATINTETSYTGLFPFAKNDTEMVVLPERTIAVENKANVQPRLLIRDFSEDFEELPTSTQLRQAAQSYVSASNINAPSISLDVEFVHLWQSPEWEQYKDLERVSLCDIVTVRHPELGVDVTAKVVETVYDPIRERYVRIAVGSTRSDMAAALQKVREDIKEAVPSRSEIQQKLNETRDAITGIMAGGNGGYVQLRWTGDPLRPYELLIMDAQTVQDAVQVWRWNQSGLAFSANGYDGPYRTAIMANGQIVADFVSTGTLDAGVIKAGILMDAVGRNYWNLETGEFHSETLNSSIEHMNGVVQFNFNSINELLQQLEGNQSESQELLRRYIRFSGEGIEVGEIPPGEPAARFNVLVASDRIALRDGAREVAYMAFVNGVPRFFMTDAHITRYLHTDNWLTREEEDGSYSVSCIGG